MTTRLYYHNSTNSTTGLPTTEQSSVTVSGGNSQSTNKNMDTTIGTSQSNLTWTGTTSAYNFGCRWISDIIGQSSIAANTWTITFGYADAAAATTTFRINLYVWRPTTTTKIGSIFDADITLASPGTTTEKGRKGTFSGSAIASGISSTDVLCLEILPNAAAPVAQAIYYDGTTVITTDNAAASSAASYIETPETITLGVIPGVTATVTGKTNTNKFINKV